MKLAALFLFGMVVLDLVCGRIEVSLLPCYRCSIASSAHILCEGDIITEDLGNLFQGLALRLTLDQGLTSSDRARSRADDSRVDSEECDSSNSIARNEDGIVAPADMSKSFGRELVEEETGPGTHESANCSQDVSHCFHFAVNRERVSYWQ